MVSKLNKSFKHEEVLGEKCQIHGKNSHIKNECVYHSAIDSIINLKFTEFVQLFRSVYPCEYQYLNSGTVVSSMLCITFTLP